MPGIVGLITEKPRQWAVAQLLQMVQTQCHEPFFAAGTWIDEALGAYVGWTALEGSFPGEMPLHNERKDVSLIFSGEDYPEPGTARRLKEDGHSLDTDGPSYLVHRYEDDPAFLAGLNGVFHGLLMDRTRGTATLFNDRYGMHRIYYHESREAFYFAAEAKAILAVRPELRRPDPRSLGEFVACGCVLENRTLFDGVQVLPPGAEWVFEHSATPRKKFYFQSQEWEEQSPLAPEPYYRELRDAFSRNLPRYFNGQAPIGIALTGGLDTRAIMAWRRPHPDSLPCYTFGGAYRECQDVLIARRVAEACQQSHQVITVGDEFLSRFSHYAERSIYLTDGCVNLARCPDLYISERAREIAPVKIVGTFGSEILGNITMFKPEAPSQGVFRPELMSHVEKAGGTYAALCREQSLSFTVFRQFPWYHFGVFANEQTHLTVRSPFLDNDFVRTAFRAPRLTTDGGDVRRQLIEDGNPILGRIRSDRGVGGGFNRVSALALRSFLEFTFKAEYAYDYGMPQWLARIDHLCSGFKPERLFLGRHKVFHFRTWYRDALAPYVREMLLDSRTLSRPYLERKAVEAVVRGHLRGDRNYTGEIHKLLTLELLHRLFFDSQSTKPSIDALRDCHATASC